MFILHAALDGDDLALWGEVAGPAGARVVRPRGGRRAPEALPHGAGTEELLRVLSEVAPALEADPGCTEERLLWAPARGHEVVPSSPLVGDAPRGEKPLELRPFRVTTLAIDTAEAIALLAPVRPGEPLAPGVLPAPDAAFFAQAVRIGGALAARQRVIPGAELSDDACRATWRPLPAPPEAQAIAAMARAMPGSARALGADASAPPEAHPSELTAGFVARVVDALMRRASDARMQALRAIGTHGVHERWLAALGEPGGYVEGDTRELTRLGSAVKQWQRPLLSGIASPFHLCLRIEEPEEDEGAWRVAYMLQAADDPSLLLPAAAVWSGAAAAHVRAVDPREVLLTSLGQAARMSDRIAASLRAGEPDGYELDSEGALAFLEEEAPLLQEAGFGVMLPAWWTGRTARSRLSLRARARPQAKGEPVGLGDFLSVDWQLALGGDPISPEELRGLARLKAPLVRFRGRWLHVGREEIRAALELLRSGKAQMSVRDLVRTALGSKPATLEGTQLEVERVIATGELGAMLDRLQGRVPFEELPPPAGLQGTLRPYQLRGYSWLSFLGGFGLGACLADDMGLGKTIQALAYLLQRRALGERRPALILCPTSVVGNWAREAEHFAPDLKLLVHHGPARSRGEELRERAGAAALVISSYALLWRDAEALGDLAWSAFVLDEAQNVKNPATHAAQTARRIRADVRIAMTGTPVENHVGELWSIMEILNPGLLGSQEQFRRRLAVPIQAGSSEAAERLRRLTAPFVLRRLKTDRSIIDDLPEKMEMKVYCTLTREQATLYAAVAAAALGEIEEAKGISRRGLILASLARLKQVCNHPRQLLKDGSPLSGRSGKLERLGEMLEECVGLGDRVLVFTQYAEMGELLKPYLQERLGREVAFLHGGVPARARTEMVARFQGDGGPPVMVLTLKAGGTGLNLTAASQVVHYDRWWNPAVEDQATDRAFRIGQTRRVQVRKLLCAGTLEDKIDALIERKRAMASAVVGSGEAFLTELSTDELRELMALREEAVD